MDAERTLTADEARRFYDRMGARQDWNRFYEDPAVEVMIRHGEFDRAHSVVEFGCGTGRLAERLLVGHLPPGARYLALDISATMVSLARERLKGFGDRAEVRQAGGSPRIDAPDGSFDRFVSTYVFDLMNRADIAAMIAEAYRVLVPGGRLCAVSLTHGRTWFERCVSKTWRGIWSLSPSALGGCRPIELSDFIGKERFEISHLEVVSSYGLSSEVLVASKR